MRIFTHKMTSSGKSKRGIRIPIALHVYASFTFIILLSSIFSFVTYNSVVSSYIESECTKRINTAVNSCASFANAFSTSSIIDENDSPEEVRATLLNSILTSTDISIDASMILLSTDNISAGFFSASEDSYQIVWPVSNYTTSSIVQSKDVLDIILLQNGLSTDKTVKAVNIDGNMYYYRFAKIEYHTGNSQHFNDYDDYYLLFYVDSSFYDDFVQSMNTALMSAMIMSIVVAGFISIIVSFPIIHTARKLSRFASQISKGDFRMIKGHMASGEFSDLSEAMNHMANKLEKNDQEQKTFFQNASHELRTPLMSIQGYAEGIKYGVFDNEKTEEAVDIIISETTRLSSMVENLLAISKMDLSSSGNYEVKKQIVNAYELSNNVIDKVRGGFLHNNKELINEIRVHDEYIYANENDIFRMLENIFANCLRYAKSNVYFKVTSDKSDIIFEIADDGPGISEDLLPYIFDRFSKGADGKHGIGLALSKAIAKEHNGGITASNCNSHTGARFTIRIPKTESNKQLSSINNNLV